MLNPYRFFNPRPRRNRVVDWFFDYWYIPVILGVLALIFVGCAVVRNSAHMVTFTVSDKAVVATGNNGNGHKYMIYTTSGDVYEDTDSTAFGKFNSANVYAQLIVGHTYSCKVAGWRVPFFSLQQNIINCTEDK